MAKKSDIIILIDLSSFSLSEFLDDLIYQVKEAVSFQISRGAVTNRKLIKLGLEPNLGRVQWTYHFFDGTCNNSVQAQQIGQPMQILTHECWDMFEEELNKAVKSYSNQTNGNAINFQSRIKNVINVIQRLQLYSSVNQNHADSGCQNPSTKFNPAEKFIFVFTTVPKDFSSLVHFAAGVNNCKFSISLSANCRPDDVQVCLVDVKFDSIKLQENSRRDTLPSFWDEFYDGEQQKPSNVNLSLKVSCLKKIMMIHKLLELRFPWMYGYSSSVQLPFGFGMGMKRLRQWEWGAQQLTIPTREPKCLSIRHCWSEMY